MTPTPSPRDQAPEKSSFERVVAIETSSRPGSVAIAWEGTRVDGALREDVFMPELGLPMDLNGDGVIDAQNHALDYKVLPVTIQLRWARRALIEE